LKKAFAFESDFERITGNAQIWRPAEGIWDGYRVVEELMQEWADNRRAEWVRT
jgi:hypothetical protein